MHSCTDTQAVCRGCGKHLKGSPYFKGGTAYDPKTGASAKGCYYGGWVCSRACDYSACLELERSMPGHGDGQRSLHGPAMQSINSKWPETA